MEIESGELKIILFHGGYVFSNNYEVSCIIMQEGGNLIFRLLACYGYIQEIENVVKSRKQVVLLCG